MPLSLLRIVETMRVEAKRHDKHPRGNRETIRLLNNDDSNSLPKIVGKEKGGVNSKRRNKGKEGLARENQGSIKMKNDK